MQKNFSLLLSSNGQSLSLGSGTDFVISDHSGFESPPCSVNLSANSQLDGAVVIDKKLLPRTLSFSCDCLSSDASQLLRNRLISFFNPHCSGTLTATVGSVSRKIAYEILSFSFTDKNLAAPPSFSVSLICPSPYWQDISEFSKNMAGIVGLFAFPLVIPQSGLALSYREFLQEAVISNPGIREIGLNVIFRAARGPVTNPVLYNLSKDCYIKTNLVMQKGDVLSFCTIPGQKRVELNGVNAIRYIDRGSSFFTLTPGDTLLKYDAAAGKQNLDVFPRFTPEYLGI